MGFVLAFTVFAMASPDMGAVFAAAVPPYVTALAKTEIMSVEILVNPSDWSSLLENANQKEYIPADVIINGVTIKNVGIRPKGSSSLGAVSQDGSGRYSLKIEFDHYIDGQTWLGLDKLCLNNMYSDTTYMKEYLSYDIMDYIGVDTPLFAYADISVNGEPLGFYLAVEAIEDSFAERSYGSNHGMLYKPETVNGDGGNIIRRAGPVMDGGGGENIIITPQGEAGKQNLTPSTEGNNMQDSPDGNRKIVFGGAGGSSPAAALQYADDDSASYAAIFDNAVFDATETDYQRVIEAIKNLNAGTELETYVDVDAVLRYFAAHTVSVNLDSYISEMLHNYYLYEKDGRVSVLPWDYNMSFGGFSSSNASKIVNFPIDSPVSEEVSLSDRPLIGKLLEVPEYRNIYHQYLQEIIDGYFNSGIFEKTFTNIHSLISAYVEKDPNSFITYEEYQASVPVLKELIQSRVQSIEGQLDGSIPSTWEGQNTNSDSLIDASAITLPDLGGGSGTAVIMVNGVTLNLESTDITDQDILAQAVDIIKAAENGALSENQRMTLNALGISDGQITRMQESVKNPIPVGQGKQMGDGGIVLAGETEQSQSATGSGTAGTGNSIVLIISFAALVLGLIFVAAFNRRKPAIGLLLKTSKGASKGFLKVGRLK